MLLQILPSLHNSYVPDGPAKVKSFASCSWCAQGQVHMYMQASPVEIKARTHWNLISHSMTTPLPVLWPSSMLLPSLSHCAFIPATVQLKQFLFDFLFRLCVCLCNCKSLKLRKAGRVCVCVLVHSQFDCYCSSEIKMFLRGLYHVE